MYEDFVTFLASPIQLQGKQKVKCTLVQALRLCTGRTAHRGSRGIAQLFLDHSTKGGEGSASRPGHSLPSGKARYPLYRRLGRPQGRSGQVQKISPAIGIRSPDLPARNQSLYRIRYPAHQLQGQYVRLGHYCFLPRHIQFINYCSSCHLILCNAS